MKDMNPADIKGDFEEAVQKHHDGTARKVFYTAVETPFPEGKLIVSRTDINGVITHCNQAFVDMSAYDRAELIGQPQAILRHPQVSAAAYADLWKTIQSGKKWSGYLRNLRKDGGYYDVFAVVVPNVRDGKIVGYASVRRRPSRKKMNDALQHYAKSMAKGNGAP